MSICASIQQHALLLLIGLCLGAPRMFLTGATAFADAGMLYVFGCHRFPTDCQVTREVAPPTRFACPKRVEIHWNHHTLFKACLNPRAYSLGDSSWLDVLEDLVLGFLSPIMGGHAGVALARLPGWLPGRLCSWKELDRPA